MEKLTYKRILIETLRWQISIFNLRRGISQYSFVSTSSLSEHKYKTQ